MAGQCRFGSSGAWERWYVQKKVKWYPTARIDESATNNMVKRIARLRKEDFKWEQSKTFFNKYSKGSKDG